MATKSTSFLPTSQNAFSGGRSTTKTNNEKGLQFQEVSESLICLELEGANDNKM